MLESEKPIDPCSPEPPKKNKMTRWPLWAGVVFFIIIAVGWLLEAPSREELFGDTGKLWDCLKTSKGGWTPNFMMGHSSVIFDSTAIATFLSHVASVLFSWMVGPFVAMKLLILCFIPLSGVSMWFFVRRIGGSPSLAAVSALFYIILPSIHVAIGIYEHWTVGMCYVFTPLMLRGIVAVAEDGSPREIVGLGLAAAGLALSYAKIAVAMMPVLVFFTLEVLRQHRGNVFRVFINYGWSLLVAGLAGLVFLLPVSREFGFAAGFLFDPLDGFKRHYALKTPLLWIDIWGTLNSGNPGLMSDAQMFQIGLIPLLGLSFALALPGLREWRATPLGRWFLVLTGCWLLSIWFASGPTGILLDHINVLNMSQGIPDTSIPILWLSLLWLAWLIYITVSQVVIRRRWIAGLITLLVLALPIFRFAELSSVYNEIRAPECFWSVGGFTCLAAAVGIAFWKLFTDVIRSTVGIVIGLFIFAELYPIHSAYWTRGLDRQLFTDYDQAAAFLKTAPIPGRVHPLSSWYYYLTLPEKSGRAVDYEALLRHFQLKWSRYMQEASLNTYTICNYLNLTGVAYILIDKQDSMVPPQMVDFYRTFYPIVYENSYFAVLANEQALYPAFLAHDFIPVPSMASVALQLLPKNQIYGETYQKPNEMPGFLTFIETIDPFPPMQMQDFFRTVYPVVYLSRYFVAPTNEQALYPGFLSQDIVALPKASYAMATAALQLVPSNLITVETDQLPDGMQGLDGQASAADQIALLTHYQTTERQPFERVPLVGNRMDDYQRMTYQLPLTSSGWLVVSEAYHPDWTVTVDGKPAEVRRAEAALLSVFVPPGSREVIFQFKQPAWYSLCLSLGTLSWIVALAALLYLPSKWAPAKWRHWWLARRYRTPFTEQELRPAKLDAVT